MKKVAIFGGSFDPPHLGHIEIVKELSKLEFIDKIIVVPTYLNPFKSSFVADATLRLNWLEQIFKSNEKVVVSDFEVKQNKKVPTIETLRHFLKLYDKVYITIGADNILSLHKWKEYENIKKLSTFIVATRQKLKVPKEFITLHVDIDISSTQLRKEIDKKMLPKEIAEEIYKYYKDKNENKS